MPEWLSVIWVDLKAIWFETDAVDLARPTYFILWMVILFLPLIGIDRRDPIAGLVYVLYCVAAGVTLVIILPEKYSDVLSLKTQFNLVMAMIFCASFRWFYKATTNKLEIKIELEEKNGETK